MGKFAVSTNVVLMDRRSGRGFAVFRSTLVSKGMCGLLFRQSSPELFLFLGNQECPVLIIPALWKKSQYKSDNIHTPQGSLVCLENEQCRIAPLTKDIHRFCVVHNNSTPDRTAPSASDKTARCSVQGPDVRDPDDGVRDASTLCTRSRRHSARSGGGVVE